MSLTPMDIHNKEFSRTFKGYNPDEVDQFLDEIIEEFEKLYKENIKLKEKLTVAAEKLGQYKTMEDTLKETLVTAQKTSEDVIDNAKEKARLIIKAAEEDSNRMLRESNQKLLSIKSEYEEIKKSSMLFKKRFLSFLNMQIDIIEQDKDLFNQESQDDEEERIEEPAAG